jgi:hypothetical protein
MSVLSAFSVIHMIPELQTWNQLQF